MLPSQRTTEGTIENAPAQLCAPTARPSRLQGVRALTARGAASEATAAQRQRGVLPQLLVKDGAAARFVRPT